MRKLLLIVVVVLAIGLAGGLFVYRGVVFPLVSSFTRRIGSIDFYGASGVDVEALRAKLPVKAGDFSTRLHFGNSRDAMFEQATGHTPVHVSAVCCDQRGRDLVFVGLGGIDPPTNPLPTGPERLSKPLLDLYNGFFFELMGSILRGNSLEDHATGYALSQDPALRAVQLRMREAALANEEELFTVSANSGDTQSRQAAAHLLGYAQRSKRQAQALTNAARDPDETVRNNATRALAVLIEAFPQTAQDLDLDYFLDLMNSSQWTDRNKASALLDQISRARDPSVLSRIRGKDLDALFEMARWKAPHRQLGLMVLGRIGGMEESTLLDKAKRGLDEEILATVH